MLYTTKYKKYAKFNNPYMFGKTKLQNCWPVNKSTLGEVIHYLWPEDIFFFKYSYELKSFK